MNKFTKNESNVIVPEISINLRNNGQSGMWTLGKNEFSSKGLAIYLYGYDEFFGNFSNSGNNDKPPENVLWWQLWFSAVEGEVPLNMVMVTYIKKESLRNFIQAKAQAEAEGLDPSKLLFLPLFAKESRQVKGNQVNYYNLTWGYKECPQDVYDSLQITEEQELLLKDETGESKLFPLKGLSKEERRILFSRGSMDASLEDSVEQAQLMPAY